MRIRIHIVSTYKLRLAIPVALWKRAQQSVYDSRVSVRDHVFDGYETIDSEGQPTYSFVRDYRLEERSSDKYKVTLPRFCYEMYGA